jgi:hypothetical protein
VRFVKAWRWDEAAEDWVERSTATTPEEAALGAKERAAWDADKKGWRVHQAGRQHLAGGQRVRVTSKAGRMRCAGRMRWKACKTGRRNATHF